MDINSIINNTLHEFCQQLANKNIQHDPVIHIEDEETNNLVEQNKILLEYTHLLLKNYHHALLKELGK